MLLAWAGNFGPMSPRRNSASPIVGLGARIKEAREAMGWTQSELGKAVGVSKSAVSQWEKGAVQNLKLGNLFTAAQVLHRDVRQLVFGDGSSPSEVAEGRPPYADIPPQRLELLQTYGRLPKHIQLKLRELILALAGGG